MRIESDAVWMPPTGEQAIVGKDRIAARYEGFFDKTCSTFELKPGTPIDHLVISTE